MGIPQAVKEVICYQTVWNKTNPNQNAISYLVNFM